MSKKLRIPSFYLLTAMAFVLLAGCTREKAEAIKNAAAQFKAEASAALGRIRYIFLESVSVPKEAPDIVVKRIATDLSDTNAIDAKTLRALIEEQSLGEAARKNIDTQLEQLSAKYNRFASMFDNLPAGSYFAGEAVKRAEKYAVEITLEFIHFAQSLESNPIQFTDRRVLLIEQINRAKRLGDTSQRTESLTDLARSVIQLGVEEKEAKQDAITHCLKAAEACRNVANLIRNYSRLSVSDILAMSREFLQFSAQVTEGNRDVATLLEKYKGVEQEIRDDPYWSAVLGETVVSPK